MTFINHLDTCELDVGVSPVEAILLHHQSVLVYWPHFAEHWQQLGLEAVPGDPRDIDLTASAGLGPLPSLWRPPVYPLATGLCALEITLGLIVSVISHHRITESQN